MMLGVTKLVLAEVRCPKPVPGTQTKKSVGVRNSSGESIATSNVQKERKEESGKGALHEEREREKKKKKRQCVSPSVEMPPIDPDRCLKERNRSVKLLHADRFVPAQRPSISTSSATIDSSDLGRATEAPHRFVMLSIERKGVAESDPRFGPRTADRKELLGEKREKQGRRGVPKESRECVHVVEGKGIE